MFFRKEKLIWRSVISLMIMATCVACAIASPEQTQLKAEAYIISPIAKNEIFLIQATQFSNDGLVTLSSADTAKSLSKGLEELTKKYRVISITPINQLLSEGSLTSSLIVQVAPR